MHAFDGYRGVFAHAVEPLLEAADVAVIQRAERRNVRLCAAAFLIGRHIGSLGIDSVTDRRQMRLRRLQRIKTHIERECTAADVLHRTLHFPFLPS